MIDRDIVVACSVMCSLGILSAKAETDTVVSNRSLASGPVYVLTINWEPIIMHEIGGVDFPAWTAYCLSSFVM